LVAVIAVPVAGCGKSGTPTAHSSPNVQVSASIPPTASPSPSRTGPLTTGAGVLPGETPPVEPAAANQHAVEGATTFIAYYFKALDWSLATTDAYLLRGLSSASCAACTRHIAGIASLQGAGSRVQGGRSSITEIAQVHGSYQVRSDYVFGLTLSQGAAQIVDGSGRIVSIQKPHLSRLTAFVSWVRGAWSLDELGDA
jgi:hypothetical protein